MALVYKALVVTGRDLGYEFLVIGAHLLRLFGRLFGQHLRLPVRRVHSLHMFLQLVLALELFAAALAQELAMVTVSQHVQLEFVGAGKDLFAERAGILLVRVECSDVLSNGRELLESLQLHNCTQIQLVFEKRTFFLIPPCCNGDRHIGHLSHSGSRHVPCAFACTRTTPNKAHNRSGEAGLLEYWKEFN